MKNFKLLQVVLVSMFVAAPGMAASLPSVGSDAPVSLCGDDKAAKSEKSEKSDSALKSEKKDDKKESKDEKNDTKGSA
jgi:hypothetical protein